jgi:hypothetical protein
MSTLGEARAAERVATAERDKQARIQRSTAALAAAVVLIDKLGESAAEAISRERWARWVAEARLARAEVRIDWLTDNLVRAGAVPEPPGAYLRAQDDAEWSLREHLLS